jgi:hypothetical protein
VYLCKFINWRDGAIVKNACAIPLETPWPTTSVRRSAIGREAHAVETMYLPRGAVIRLERRSCIKHLRVISGLVWLTATPANGDVLLASGEMLNLKKDWPFVVEALEPAELILLRTAGKSNPNPAANYSAKNQPCNQEPVE